MDKVHPAPAALKNALLVKNALRELVKKKSGKEKIYLYTTSVPTFNFNVLLEQFLVQLFNPFSRVYLYRTYGKYAVRNQFPPKFSIYQTVVHLFWICPIFYFSFRDELTEGGITAAEVGISYMAAIMFRLVVASKYASMTHTEYMTFLMCEDENLATEYQHNMQLNTGWLSIDIGFCAHEANLALSRMGFIHGWSSPPCFEIDTDLLPYWGSLLGESGQVLHTRECSKSKKNVNVDVADLMALVVSACDHKHLLRYLKPIAFVVVVSFGMLPCIVRVSCSSLAELVTYDDIDDVDELCKSTSFFGDGALANVFSVMLMINTMTVALPLSFFFVATILGTFRHQKCAKVYAMLARIDVTAPPLSEYPVLDMTIHTNIRAWVRSMLALHFFGNRYYNRVDIYAKLCALILVGLLIWLYVFSLQISSDATGANELILDIRYWSVCFLLIVWGSAFGVILAIIAETNFKMEQLEVQFVLHRLSVREKKQGALLQSGPGSFLDAVKRNSIQESAFQQRRDDKKSFKDVVGALEEKTVDDKLEVIFQRAEMVSQTETQPLQVVNQNVEDGEAKESVDTAMEKEALDDLMDTAVMILETQTRVNPRRFLGANASYALVQSYVVAFGTLIGLSLSVAGINYSSA